jgi:hypothetical protein
MAKGSQTEKAYDQGIADRIAGLPMNNERYRGRPNVWTSYLNGFRSRAAVDQLECLGLSEFGDVWEETKKKALEYTDNMGSFPRDHMRPRNDHEQATLLLQLLAALRAGRDYHLTRQENRVTLSAA